MASQAGNWAAGVPGGIFRQTQSPLKGGGKTNLEVWEFYLMGRWNNPKKKAAFAPAVNYQNSNFQSQSLVAS
ncbi:hypothetical protein [Microcoleus sp. BROC3]|uniref:hypothetical protein n=1 Tax=Microcoleus sp. BROC3 TaxID=3055323 RepID=UPI002FD5DD28